METWRAIPVPGYGENYEVSDLGGICNARTSRVLKPSLDSYGYHIVTLRYSGRRRTFKIHRLVLLAFVGDPPPGSVTCHNNGDRVDNRLENLRYGTVTDNNRDTVRHGTHVSTRKTECPHGHPFDEENTYYHPSSGRRKCRACDRERHRKYKAAQ